MSFKTHSLYADVAHLVERHLAKVEVASSSLVIRSKRSFWAPLFLFLTFVSRKEIVMAKRDLGFTPEFSAGWKMAQRWPILFLIPFGVTAWVTFGYLAYVLKRWYL